MNPICQIFSARFFSFFMTLALLTFANPVAQAQTANTEAAACEASYKQGRSCSTFPSVVGEFVWQAVLPIWETGPLTEGQAFAAAEADAVTQTARNYPNTTTQSCARTSEVLGPTYVNRPYPLVDSYGRFASSATYFNFGEFYTTKSYLIRYKILCKETSGSEYTGQWERGIRADRYLGCKPDEFMSNSGGNVNFLGEITTSTFCSKQLTRRISIEKVLQSGPTDLAKRFKAKVITDSGPVRDAQVSVSIAQPTNRAEQGEIGYPSSGYTDANGDFFFKFIAPGISTHIKTTQTLAATCIQCDNPATIDIPVSPILVGFFNGVWNTEKQANEGRKALEIQTDAVRSALTTSYELFYNQTGCGTAGATCLQDVAEVFALRSLELDGVMSNRWELFWDLLAGRHTTPSSGAGGLLGFLGNLATSLAQLLDSTFNAILNQVFAGYTYLLSNPPTSSDVANHLAKLQGYADQDYSFVLVAHSQGNLFVNQAFDGLLASRPAAAAKVVHIAPASPTLRGDYTLADIDLVINGLRTQGVTTVPEANLALPFSRADASGHTLVNTYLDASRAALERVKEMLKTALTSL